MKKILITFVVFVALVSGQVVAYAQDVAAPQQNTPSAEAPALRDSLAVPRPIPCVPSLPCVSEYRQQSGYATRAYVLQEYGTELMVTFLGFIALASVIFIIYGGLQMHIALGNDDAIGKARKTVLWAVGGLVVAMLSGAIITIITKISFEVS